MPNRFSDQLIFFPYSIPLCHQVKGWGPILLLSYELFHRFFAGFSAILFGLFLALFSDRPAQLLARPAARIQQQGLRRFLPFLYLVIYLRNLEQLKLLAFELFSTFFTTASVLPDVSL